VSGVREVYLDWNATTPPHPQVLAAMQRAAAEAWANPASVHAAGRRARARLEEAREAVAGLFRVHPRDVLFTSGGTEANNLALRSAAALCTSRLEHPSVIRVAEAIERAGRPVEWLPVPESGRIEPGSVLRALGRLPPGATVALMAANHESGVVQPLEEVAAICRSAGALLHVDAVQAVGKLEPSRWRFGDSFSLAGHKIRGPKGIGALAWRSDRGAPEPLLLGGAQERGLRPGTVDAVSAAGLSAAVARIDLLLAATSRQSALRDRLEAELAGVAVRNGAAEPRLPHVSNLSVCGWRGDELAAALDLGGVRVSSGSACAAGTSEPSPVVLAMLGPERARSALRVSLGEETTSSEIEIAIDELRRVLAREVHTPSRAT
jgi:cysteine desulfurase